MRHIIPISGKDSAATAIVQNAIDPSLDYEYVFNPTGAELPPVFDWLNRMSDYLGKRIVQVGDSLQGQIERWGILPSPRMRFCTKYCKIQPLESYLSGEPATVYYGLRHDEPERVGHSSGFAKNRKSEIVPAYPLRDMELGLPGVWRILEDRGLLPPFFEWELVTEQVRDCMGGDFAVAESLQPWEYRSLFAWRRREFNCAWCIFMRQYEFIGLHEHYPGIFWQAVEIEEGAGASGYTIIQGVPLRRLIERADEIRQRRVKQICDVLYKGMQLSLYGDEMDLLDVASCGLFCGK